MGNPSFSVVEFMISKQEKKRWMKVNALKLILKDLRGKFGETNFKRQEKKKIGLCKYV